ncbi:S41 family peptidase [Janthinobacterium sp. HH01]|uniref:S41 family peptidase n=1 Tax=Janthinobacterium sp. HH01 TaxID=1198452 RepID=UPI002570AB00|nr:S41 family peptidase [Janthinobacterium sp. HH01]
MKNTYTISTQNFAQAAHQMNIKLRNILALVAFGLFLPAATAQDISAQQLREDIAFIRQTIGRAHPDLRFSTNPESVNSALNAAAADIPVDLSRDQAWQRLSTLNPVFADAHFFVGYTDWMADSTAHLASGGAFFPFEVDIDSTGKLYIRAALGAGPSELANARILSINGVPAEKQTAELLKRMHGDTPQFRSNLLARRWWFYHWKMYGAAAQYRLELSRAGRRWSVSIPASASAPALLQAATSFDRQFSFELQPEGKAVLKAGSFSPEFKDRFLDLARTSFARMRQEGATILFIDISDNGGGDDQLWLDGLMPYIATRPYRTGSTYTKRVAEANPQRGESAGQIVDGEIQTWHEPQTAPPLLFKGKVVVAIGPSTYSSAVLFANVVQDFGFGTLAGKGGAARRSQSGGTRKFTLPNSGLVLWVPRFVLAPPSGGPRDALLAPARE